jgi:hypothetical protein
VQRNDHGELCRARAYMAIGDSREAILDLERAVVADPRCELVLREELDVARRAANSKADDHYAVLGTAVTSSFFPFNPLPSPHLSLSPPSAPRARRTDQGKASVVGRGQVRVSWERQACRRGQR